MRKIVSIQWSFLSAVTTFIFFSMIIAGCNKENQKNRSHDQIIEEYKLALFKDKDFIDNYILDISITNFNKNKNAPIVNPSVTDLNDLLNPNSYQKGGWVLHMLHEKMGDLKFREGLKRYYDKYQFSNALTEDFQKVMEDMAGYSLSEFFKQWIYRPGHPQLNVVWSHKKGKMKVTVTQTQAGEPFIFPLEMGFNVPGAKTSFPQTVNISQKTQEFSFDMEQKPTQVVLDPGVKLLFEGKVTEK